MKAAKIAPSSPESSIVSCSSLEGGEEGKGAEETGEEQGSGSDYEVIETPLQCWVSEM